MARKEPLHILVHNVSHHDFFVSFRTSGAGAPPGLPFARPHFHCFDPISRACVDRLEATRREDLRVITHPDDRGRAFPVGVSLDPPIAFRKWTDFKVRDSRLVHDDGPVANGCYFPLLAVLLPRWRAMIREKERGGRKVLFLISGSGTPRDARSRCVRQRPPRSPPPHRRALPSADGRDAGEAWL